MTKHWKCKDKPAQKFYGIQTYTKTHTHTKANVSFHISKYIYTFNCTGWYIRAISNWLSQFNLFIWICKIIRAKNPPKMHLKRCTLFPSFSIFIAKLLIILHSSRWEQCWWNITDTPMRKRKRTNRKKNYIICFLYWKLLHINIVNWIIYIVILTAHINLKFANEAIKCNQILNFVTVNSFTLMAACRNLYFCWKKVKIN